ncbi:V-type ATP synthase subunit G [Streptococcus gordonii]|uniref:V-type ATP synthase subunit G n=1 Tax=Streptococcus gordonii TaxID=1302 RepID=A0A139N2V8_STRGN|nr:V-type ATP synthase subunit G [Streptococcus gordonii]
MANETLEKMQEIETAAEEVLMGYRTQVQELRRQVDEDLRQLSLTYDDETQKLAEELTVTSQQKLVLLQQDLEQTSQQNEDKVAAALTDKKADLARAIVEKVVEAYGH